ncbi:MAG: sulfur carrier protein ThiS [Bacteroidales bacterium]|nr:sulfur carrier protein ThiS [Bacteroidales bacterium]
MQIYVNDRATETAEGQTLQTWLAAQGLADRKGLAVALNGAVVSRDKWASQTLQAQDKIILIGVFYGG